MVIPETSFTWHSITKRFGHFEFSQVQAVRRDYISRTHELDLTYSKNDGTIKTKKFSIRFNENKTEITASEIWRFGILYFHRSTNKSRALKRQYDSFLSRPYRQSTFTLPTKIKVESHPLTPTSDSSNSSIQSPTYINFPPSTPLPNRHDLSAKSAVSYDLFTGYGSLQHVIEDLDISPDKRTLVIFQVEGVILSQNLTNPNQKFKITSAQDTENLERLKANYTNNMIIIFISEDGDYQGSYIQIPFLCNYKQIPDDEFPSSQGDILSQASCLGMAAVRIIASDTNLIENLSDACRTRKIQDTKCYQFVGNLKTHHEALAKNNHYNTTEELYEEHPQLKVEYNTWAACPGKVYKVRH
ncbi:MAG: hypothetical protein HAW66_09000 [Shewanella sp.]|nr:hypothetical protein [Shewanella sp.]